MPKDTEFPFTFKSRVSGQTRDNFERFRALTHHSLSDLMRYRLDGTTILGFPVEWIVGALSVGPQTIESQRSRILLTSNQIKSTLTEFDSLLLHQSRDPLAHQYLYELLRQAGGQLKTLMLVVSSLAAPQDPTRP